MTSDRRIVSKMNSALDKRHMTTISFIGAGYVGLVTGTCLSEFGLNVICMDSDASKIRELEEGRVPIFEPGLPSLIAKNVAAGRLRFTTEISVAVNTSQVIFLAVPTPSGKDGSADLRHVLSAADAIAAHMTEYKVIVNKSTVPIGTSRKVKEIIQNRLHRRGLILEFDVVSNPEFLREGSAIRDFMHPDRIVIGSENSRSREIIRDIYNVLYLIETPFIFTSLETAELVKYASNAFLATKIAFINEIAALCDTVNADVHDVARAMGMDGRIGKYFLHPGPGYGGSCLPKDTKALVKMGQEQGLNMNIVAAVVMANKLQRERMVTKIESALGNLNGKVITVLGLAFKQGTDDVRESSAIWIIQSLLEKRARIRIFDPQAMDNAKRLPFTHIPSVDNRHQSGGIPSNPAISPPSLTYCKDEYDAAIGADALVILTEWNQFRHLDLGQLARSMHGRYFFDFRNLYDPGDVISHGFIYEAVGRPRA